MQEGGKSSDAFGVGRTNTLRDLPDIPQVESIVALGWSWQKLSFSKLENLQAGLRQLLTQVAHCLWEFSQIVADKGREDGVDDV